MRGRRPSLPGPSFNVEDLKSCQALEYSEVYQNVGIVQNALDNAVKGILQEGGRREGQVSIQPHAIADLEEVSMELRWK